MAQSWHIHFRGFVSDWNRLRFWRGGRDSNPQRTATIGDPTARTGLPRGTFLARRLSCAALLIGALALTTSSGCWRRHEPAEIVHAPVEREAIDLEFCEQPIIAQQCLGTDDPIGRACVVGVRVGCRAGVRFGHQDDATATEILARLKPVAP